MSNTLHFILLCLVTCVFVAANVIVCELHYPRWVLLITAIGTVSGMALYLRFVYAKDLY